MKFSLGEDALITGLNCGPYLFSLAECEKDFFKYSFGTESFKRILLGVDKDMVHL